ncbi:MAG: hypothetical protein ACPLW7_04265 [Minisyncoccia bacterium]|jgi:ribulose-phosphate 3-epimerase
MILFSNKNKPKKEIIPVINVKTIKKLEERLKTISRYNGIIQIDIADGIFTPWKTWNNPEYLKNLKNIISRIELHLMVYNPETVLPLWLESRPKRIIIHKEAIKDFKKIKELFKQTKTELGIALKPLTPFNVLNPIIKEIDYVVFLSVEPGPSGQKFEWFVLDKIDEFKKEYSQIKLEIDGGVNEETISEILKTNVDFLAIGSAIFDKEDPMKQIKYFNDLIKK